MLVDTQRSQNNLTACFNDKTKRVMISESGGRKYLELDPSLFYRILAYLFGIGPAAFKNVVGFCADHNIYHLKLKEKAFGYNKNHASHKKITEEVIKRLPEKPPQPKPAAVPQKKPETPYEQYFEVRDSQNRNDFINGCIAEKVDDVKMMLQHLTDVRALNYIGYDGRTALMHAVTKRNKALVEALLAAGADPKFEVAGTSAMTLCADNRELLLLFLSASRSSSMSASGSASAGAEF